MMTRKVPKGELHMIVLECHHVMLFNKPTPVVRSLLYCVRCQAERRVTSAPPDYRIRCQSCRLSRVYGRDLWRAEAAGARHLTKRPGHRVGVYDGGKLLKNLDSNESIPLDIPF